MHAGHTAAKNSREISFNRMISRLFMIVEKIPRSVPRYEELCGLYFRKAKILVKIQCIPIASDDGLRGCIRQGDISDTTDMSIVVAV